MPGEVTQYEAIVSLVTLPYFALDRKSFVL